MVAERGCVSLRVLLLSLTTKHCGGFYGYWHLTRVRNDFGVWCLRARHALEHDRHDVGIQEPGVLVKRDDEWPEWSFKMRAHCIVMSNDLVRVLERAESLTAAVTIEMLEQVCPGKTTLVRQAY